MKSWASLFENKSILASPWCIQSVSMHFNIAFIIFHVFSFLAWNFRQQSIHCPKLQMNQNSSTWHDVISVMTLLSCYLWRTIGMSEQVPVSPFNLCHYYVQSPTLFRRFIMICSLWMEGYVAKYFCLCMTSILDTVAWIYNISVTTPFSKVLAMCGTGNFNNSNTLMLRETETDDPRNLWLGDLDSLILSNISP